VRVKESRKVRTLGEGCEGVMEKGEGGVVVVVERGEDGPGIRSTLLYVVIVVRN
jgi:hypothetical protein